ncbi:MAG TPA: hypothetical protein VFU98_07625 [Microlunatus sp.]|nr:hypothetical protein [Microlunatus sp.]
MLESFHAARVRRNHARRTRLERAQLQADLASFTSDADRFDLEATLDRYPSSETLEIRRILAQQAVS